MSPPASTRARTATLSPVIDRIVGSTGVLEAINEMGPLARAARHADPEDAFVALSLLADRHDSDPLATYLAIYAMADVDSWRVDEALIGYLGHESPGMRRHAAWALSRRGASHEAVAPLQAVAGEGGFSRMMAELALENWADERNELPAKPRFAGPGMRIAQVLMQGRVDADLTGAGSGDGGGLVTLQVGLAEQLANSDAVADSYLVTRRIKGEGKFAEPRQAIGEHGTLVRLDFGPEGYLPTAELWAHRAELERELRRFLISEGPFDAVHLRFADVGTFAAARAATDLGIPIYFTLAPDPHVVIASAEKEGRLDRQNFAEADLESHYLFRAWMLEWMLENAERLALLPRRNQRQQFKDLLNIDIDEDGDRFRVIPEGIDYTLTSRSREAASAAAPPAEWVTDLVREVEALPEQRRGLPLMVTVGRLNRIKGMHRVVAGWQRDPTLRDGFNLVVIGGELRNPSPEEMAVMDAMAEETGGRPFADIGLILMGNQPHHAVSDVLAATIAGVGDTIGPHGIYICGSDKEEFGLAILEAMGAGLPVVAPIVGGPSTYVEDGFTGALVDTSNLSDLVEGMRWAASVRTSEVRREAARRIVRDHYSLGAMAEALVDMYGAEIPGTAV